MTSLLVRERPALDLAIQLSTPGGGVSYQHSADDSDPGNVPSQLTLTDTMPGGDDEATWSLARDPRIQHPDLQPFSDVQVRGLGGSVLAWQGRLEESPDTGGQQAAVSPQAYGYQALLQDNENVSLLGIDSDLSNWSSAPALRTNFLTVSSYQLASGSVAADPLTNAPALLQSIQDSWVSPYEPIVENWYDAGGALVAAVYYAFTSQVDASSWSAEVFTSSDAENESYSSSNLIASVFSGSGKWVPTAAQRFAGVQFAYFATPAGAAGATWFLAWDALQVIGDHGLTLGGSGPYTLLASQMIAYALQQWVPGLNFTTGASGSIRPSAFGINQAVYSATTVSAIIADLIQYELLDWAVEGKTFYLNARGARGRTWVSSVGECQLQETGPQASTIYNNVVVGFTAADGTAATVGPSGSGAMYVSADLTDPDTQNPATLAGLTRTALLQVQTPSLAGAIQAGETFLEVQTDVTTAGQAALVGHIQDYQTGAWWPAWMARSGDSLIVRDASDPSPRRIVSKSYDDSSKTNTVQLDQPPQTLAAVMAQMAQSTSPLSLS